MKRVEHWKIVRDRIPEIIEKNGGRAICRVVCPEEAVKGLEKKLSEELTEYLEEKSVEELADLLEVMHGLLLHRGISWDELERIRLQKREERGGFEQGICLEAVEEDD